MHQWLELDPVKPEVKNSICQSLSRVDCSRWRQCCSTGIQCCERQIQRQRYHSNRTMTPHGTAMAESCEMTWDGYSCWADVPAGYSDTQACPTYMPLSQPLSKQHLLSCRFFTFFAANALILDQFRLSVRPFVRDKSEHCKNCER